MTWSRPSAAAAVLAAALVAVTPAVAGAAPRPTAAATDAIPAGDPYVVAAAPGAGADGIAWTDTRTRRAGVLTGTGAVSALAVSPDGSAIAYRYGSGAGVGVVDAYTGEVEVQAAAPDGATYRSPAVSPDGRTVAFLRETASADEVLTMPVGAGSPTDTGLAAGGAFALAYAADGDLLLTPTAASCALAERAPTASGAASCVLTAPDLEGVTGHDRSAVTGIAAPTTGPATAALTVLSTDTGSPAQTYDAGVLADGTVTLLPAAHGVVSGSAGTQLTSPSVDPAGTEVTLKVDAFGSGSSASYVESVDTATGTHVARVATVDPFDPVAAAVPPTSPQPSVFVPLAAPVRVLDTRRGTGAAAAPVKAGTPIDVDVTGQSSGVPTDATAVVANLTGTDVSASTYLQLYPTPAAGTTASVPTVSNLNLVRGQTAANAVTVAVTGGRVRLGNAVGSVDAILDVTGYYVPAADAPAGTTTSTFTAPGTPTRVVDTRHGTGVPQATLGPKAYADWTVPTGTDPGTVPAGATAVVLGVGGIARAGATYVTAFPAPSTGSAVPTVSTVSLAAGETRANLATVALPASRTVRFYNAAGSTDVFADLVGYYTPDASGSLYVPLAPSRVFDSRSGTNEVGGAARIDGGRSVDLRAAGSITTGSGQNVVGPDATAIQVNLTAANETAPTFLSLFATPDSGDPVPTFSSLNAPRATNIANAAITAVGAGLQARLYSAAGSTDAIVDVAGYFVPAQ